MYSIYIYTLHVYNVQYIYIHIYFLLLYTFYVQYIYIYIYG